MELLDSLHHRLDNYQLLASSCLLFGGFHGHGFMRPPGKPEHLHHLWGKVKNMSPEERRNYIRQRFEERQQVFNDDIFGEEKPKE